MTGHLRTRLGAAFAIGAIWLAAIAAPASAATSTVRYVDDNIATACHGTHFHTIQGAINASNAQDVVYVCPGTYHEQLQIDVPGLTVQSLKFRKAHLVPPASPVFPAVVEISADGAKLRGFDIRIPAGDFNPCVACATATSSLATQCEPLEAAVVVLAQRVGVWGNYIDAIGDNTLSGDCGYDIGILFLDSATQSALPLGHDKSTAKRNYIRDFKIGGIIVEGEQSVRIWDNSIRFVHLDDPATCVLVNTITVTPTVAYPCAPIAGAHVNPLNGVFGEAVGIGVAGGPLVQVGYNTVFSTLDFALLFDGGEGIPLAGGIIFFGAAPGSLITENQVDQVFIGIAVDPVGLTLARPTGVSASPGGVEITFNRTNEGFFGIIIGGDDNYLYANRARLNAGGIGIFDGANNQFINNDARYNLEVDCYDETGGGTGSGTAGTDNTWEDNFGNNNEPEEICIDTGFPL
jgi:hypothetical protein